MANARVKRVLGALADLYSRPKYVADILTSLREPLMRSDIIEVPGIGSLTVADGSASGSAQDVSNQQVNPSVLTLTADEEPAIFVEVEQMKNEQIMDGAYYDQVAMQAMSQLRTNVDFRIINNFTRTVAFDAAGTYHVNVASDALVRTDILQAKAALEAQDGAHSLALVMSAYGWNSVLNLAEFIPNFTASEQGILGIPKIGTVFGIPVYMSNGILSGATVDTTAVTVASNVATATVAAGHGFVAGMKIKNSGLTDSGTNTGTVAITSVTATTIVFPFTAANGAQADGVGTLTDQSEQNLMLDIPHCYVALQKLPSVREVPYFNRTSNSLQISAIMGKLARTNKLRVIHTPLQSL